MTRAQEGPGINSSPSRTERIDLPSDPHAPSLARRFVMAALDDAAVTTGGRDVVDLLTSELVTNAVIHTGGGTIQLCVSASPSAVRVEVVDDSADHPTPRHPSPEQLGGRGLLLVEELADSWGHQSRPGGKAVWFEVAFDRAVEETG